MQLSLTGRGFVARLTLGLLVIAGVVSPLCRPAPAAAVVLPISVGDNVQVSVAHPKQQHYEVIAGADPSNPMRLIACSHITLPEPQMQDYSAVVYQSLDGGNSWRDALHVNGGDPACTFGGGGVAYFSILGRENGLYRSTDGGRHWSRSAIFEAELDRAYVTVDTSSAKFRGRVYVNAFTSIAPYDKPDTSVSNYELPRSGYTVYRSSNNGVSLAEPYSRFSSGERNTNAMGPGVTLTDGTYAFVFIEFSSSKPGSFDAQHSGEANGSVKVILSRNGGKTFQDAVVAARAYLVYSQPFKASFTNSVGAVIAADTSHGPFNNRLYVAWPDYRSGRCQVMLAYSSDGAKTWSSPIAVNDDVARPHTQDGPDDFMPTITVNNHGIVGLMWYDRRNRPDNLGYDVRFAASNDGGVTFSRSVAVSTAPSTVLGSGKQRIQSNLEGFDLTGNLAGSLHGGGTGVLGINSRFGYIGGDTAGLAASLDGRFHAVWVDNRSGYAQLWTAPITVDSAAVRNGAAELAALNDVTDKTRLDFSDTFMDWTSGTLSFDMSVENSSRAALRGPLKLRISQLRSGLGEIVEARADARVLSEGSVLDIKPQGAGTALARGARSTSYHVSVRIHSQFDVHDTLSATNLVNMLDIRGRVFASSK